MKLTEKIKSILKRPFASFSRGYDAVKWEYSRDRREAVVETAGEEKQLNTRDRNKLINLHRDLMRNAPEIVTQDQQVRVNVAGWEGGKIFASFGPKYTDAAKEVMTYFNRRWARKAEMTRSLHFNQVLKNVITAMDAGGDVVLVFDDGILTGGNGTGRIRGFEADEIACIPESEFKKRFPASWTQCEGFIINESGMVCGCFVSTSQRGRKVFSPDLGFITLKFDPYDDDICPNFTIIGDTRRFNQIRAISPTTAAITTAIDLHEARGSETLATKLNSQLVAQIIKTGDEAGPIDAPAGFGQAGAQANAEARENDAEARVVDMTPLKAIGARILNNPEGVKTELLDTKRPNPNFIGYAEHMQGVVGGTRGLPRLYNTLKVQTSYTGFRGEQKLAETTFRETQKYLERQVCDWAVRCVITRAVKLGLVTAALPDYWYESIAWKWPVMAEVSVKEAETGRQLKLKNGVTSLTREVGPGELEKLVAEMKHEKELFEDAGLVYQPAQTVSGQLVTSESTPGEEDSPEDHDNNETTENGGDENEE